MRRNSIIYIFLKKCEHPKGAFWNFVNSIFCTAMNIIGGYFYRRLKNKYPGKALLVMPSASMGDVLILNAYIEELLDRFGIDDYNIIIDNRFIHIAEQIHVKNVVGEANYVISSMIMRMTHSPEKMVRCYNIFPAILFDYRNSSTKLKTVYPQFDSAENIDELNRIYGISIGKTVIISPYEQHITVAGMKKLSLLFWEELVQGLIDEGYEVLTNCNLKAGELPIKGSNIFFPKVSDLSRLVDSAGYIIGVRSGLFDYLGETDAKKIVLYPNSDFLKMWSIKDMWQAKNTEELVYGEGASEHSLVIRCIEKLN